MVTYHFYFFIFFETVLDREHSGTVSKKSSQLLFLRNHFSSPSEPAILNKSTMCLGLKSSPRLKYKLSKVDYSPTPWGLVIHWNTCKPPRMPHVSPGWGGGGGFPLTGALSRVSYLPSHAFLRRRCSFTSRKQYAFLEKFLCFLQLSDRAYVSGARCIGLFLLWSFWYHRIQM